MLTREELAALSAAIPARPDLEGLVHTLQARAAPVLAALPPIPRAKALLSRDGGVCPTDGTTLSFDPWNPDRHRCPRCGASWSGERHHRYWARAQHLWLAERSAELAMLGAATEDAPAAARAGELLRIYEELYLELPNRDSVLGPSHLFFSTYLESLWLTSYLAAAHLLREAGLLAEERIEGVNRVADEAANLIGDFNEGLSNRQTWHAAALTAIGVWFDDGELVRTSVESRTGLLGHLADGFGEDGMWWEGENYHLFALRGLMQGIHWARAAGFDLLEDPELRAHFRSALLAPALSALPDFTYPARRDARYGVSLAQPASLELWEIGRGWLGPDEQLEAWLAALYRIPLPLPPAEHYDAWLHDAGRPEPERRTPADLSWWTLTALEAQPETAGQWIPRSLLLPSQGLAVLRQEDRYASLECGAEIGGHGHPDRLHLSAHASGVHWLPDQGTGSYVQPALAWYRSALCHNAPLLDGANAGAADAWCEAFDSAEALAWCRGKAGELRRTLVAGPGHLLDILEVDAAEERDVLLPWHLQGKVEMESWGRWEPAELEHPFVSKVERDVPQGSGPRVVTARHAESNAELRLFLLAPDAELLRALAPGLPSEPEPKPFLLLRARASKLRWVSVLDFAPADSPEAVRGIAAAEESVTVETRAGEVRYQFTASGLSVKHGSASVALAGLRAAPPRHRPFFEVQSPPDLVAFVPRLASPPALDGTLEGFDLSAPLLLDSEHQYRRSEEPYDPERFSAQAWLNWDGEALYLAVAVSKRELSFRAPDAPPLLLDNDPEDIHSDGVQLYWRADDAVRGFVVVPQGQSGIQVRGIAETRHGDAEVSGRFRVTSEGYLVTLRLDDPAIRVLGPEARLGFDLLVNEMQPGRLRRAGQLVWSGGGGWVYLKGDRQSLPAQGNLELG